MAGTNNLQVGDEVVVDFWDGCRMATLLEPIRARLPDVHCNDEEDGDRYIWVTMIVGLHLPLRKRHP